MTLQEFNSVFNRLLETFGETNISEIKIEVYFNLLKEFSLKEFSEACKKVLLSYEYKNGLPMLATFYKACQEAQDGDLEAKALEAFNIAKREVINTGEAESVYFCDKALQGAIYDFGGWVAFCHADFESGTGIANERKFIECYKKAYKLPLKCAYLAGTNEMRNGFTNFDKNGAKQIAVKIIYKSKEGQRVEQKKLLTLLENKGLFIAKKQHGIKSVAGFNALLESKTKTF